MERLLSHLAARLFKLNYDYLWLRTMLEKCAQAPAGSTLITGSSHALYAVKESCWKNAVNCSMHSQDLYYDFLCARRAITSAKPRSFERCFIVMGYYIAYQDLSRSKFTRETLISNVYYPIFQDAHNWSDPVREDLQDKIGNILSPAKKFCERAAAKKILKYGTYYSLSRSRKPHFDLKGRTWAQAPEAQRLDMGQARAAEHNRLFQHKQSFEENKRILTEFVRFLHEHKVTPIVVTTPFTPEYHRFLLPEVKAGALELLSTVSGDIHYVDFNQSLDLFEPADFVDTDHLSASGAEKISRILAGKFGV